MSLIEQFSGKSGLEEGTLMFCGTLAARGGIRPSDLFEFELDDPVLGRKIQHQYRVQRFAGARMKQQETPSCR